MAERAWVYDVENQFLLKGVIYDEDYPHYGEEKWEAIVDKDWNIIDWKGPVVYEKILEAVKEAKREAGK